MRRSRTTLTLAGIVFAASLAACGDSATEPQPQSLQLVSAPATPSFLVRVEKMSADSTSATFTVDRDGGVFQIGPHAIYFPRRAICDPATSTYGPTEWDKPCNVLRGSVRIHAEVRKINGKEWVDFTPSLRFVPSNDTDRWVWIWMKTDRALDNAFVDDFRILWTPGFDAEGVDESLADPTLKTYAYPKEKIVYRRIKHFSGYQVATDFASSHQLSLPGLDGAGDGELPPPSGEAQ